MSGFGVKSIVDSAFEEVARQAVRGVIAEEVGSGIEDEVKKAILEMAREMIRDDKEIRKKLREAMLYWIRDSMNDHDKH